MAIRILVSGANGQLGRALNHLGKRYDHYHFDFKSKNELDLSSEASIQEAFQKPYDYVINAGAFTKVDLAESQSELCYAINGYALNHLCNYAPSSCTIIHLSTDYVYDHNPGRPLMESDDTHPRSVYAKSKLLGEDFLREQKENHVILRTSWVYAEYGHNFVKSMIRLGREKEQLSIVSDQIGSPSYALDIAETILEIIDSLKKKPENSNICYGTFNYSNSGHTTWADFARRIFEKSGIECKVINTSTEEYNAPAPRPLWSVMSKEKIKSVYNLRIPEWQASLDKCLSRLLPA